MCRRIFIVLIAGALAGLPAKAQQAATPSREGSKELDAILDLYVRDGEVYYRALKLDRRKLDDYTARLSEKPAEGSTREEQLAFWLNGYNALVLKTIVDHYPIQGRSSDYPAKSIRQIPGAFERVTHHIGGRTLTLDQIEQTVLTEFHDPRVFMAIGRGAEGGGRLRSEAFNAGRLEHQLAEVAAECASRVQCVQVDPAGNRVMASAIFSWRETDFTESLPADGPFASRSPIERAILAFVQPHLLTTEKEFLAKDTFQLAYRPFDWRLNDLTGRGGR